MAPSCLRIFLFATALLFSGCAELDLLDGLFTTLAEEETRI